MNPFVSGDLVAPEMAVACAVLSAQIRRERARIAR
jgi:hypothetical protein